MTRTEDSIARQWEAGSRRGFRGRLGRWVGVGGAFVVCLLASCRPSVQSSESADPPPPLETYCDRPLGNPDAAIAVQTMLPVGTGCQDTVGLYLAGLAETHPDVFRVQIHDMKSETGRAVMRSNGIRCAAVLVDGSTRFDLGTEHGKVLLEGPMDPMDVYRVLCMKVASLGEGDLNLPIPPADDAPNPQQRREAGFR